MTRAGNRRLRWWTLAAVLLITAPWAHADEEDEDSAKTEAPLVIGADDDGGIGAKLKFSRVDTFRGWELGSAATGTLYWGATANGTWSSKKDSKHEIDAGAELGFVTGFATLESDSKQLFTLALAFQGRRGKFESPTGQLATADEYLYGPKLIYRFTTTRLNDFLQNYGGDLGEYPTITVGWYRIGGSSTELIEVPDRLQADQLYAQFRFDTPVIPLSRKEGEERAVTLALLVQATKPLDGPDRKWGKYIDATFSVGIKSRLKPAISFQSGEKDGFHYDRQLLLGLVWDFWSD